MNPDRYQNVACPKCKGGCALCGGTGRVLSGVADSFSREEMRATVKVEKPTGIPKDALRTSGVPAVILRAHAMKHAAWAFIAAGVSLAVLFIVLLMRGCS